jgi:hypothetical protein
MSEKLIATSDAELWLSPLPRTGFIDIQAVLPSFPRSSIPLLKALILIQRSDLDFMQELQGYEAKDQHLEQFFTIARAIQVKLAGNWVDYFDPSTGLPMLSPQGSSIWNDVDMIQRMLKLPVVAVGGCQLLVHPIYGSNCYPGVILTTADYSEVRIACVDLSLSPASKREC